MGELLDKAEGKVKQAAGAATGRRSLEAEGKGIFLRGKVKEQWEDFKRGIREVWRGEPQRRTRT